MSKLTLVELSAMPRKPHGCPAEVERSWARLVATHKSVSGLFVTLNELRAAQDDMRGAVSETHRDQARAAIVFTAAGIDACLRTLLRDSLHTLLLTAGAAHGAFVSHFMANRLTGDLTAATKKAVVDIDPRSALIDLYVGDLTGASIQGAADLVRCRNALGLKNEPALDDAILTGHQPFFNARHEVVHELDLVDPSGKGTRGRRHRDLAAVGAQCDGTLQLMHAFIAPTARAVKQARREMGWSTP
ncbi:hypothetical protein [Streptomyces javensis]|uniref:RiboL-PSP-HEPN domain-containing protein n=1 Tax=Streptomyces javensis TaxID=114698 RepID=A0ABS0R2U4_9ACTN|nr:hypothetical protein [Streptomyces javensis]MBI0311610.1 hypothetical protein [Streptomyces javensis]